MFGAKLSRLWSFILVKSWTCKLYVGHGSWTSTSSRMRLESILGLVWYWNWDIWHWCYVTFISYIWLLYSLHCILAYSVIFLSLQWLHSIQGAQPSQLVIQPALAINLDWWLRWVSKPWRIIKIYYTTILFKFKIHHIT